MAVKFKDQKKEQKPCSSFLQRWLVRLGVLALLVSAFKYLDSVRVRFQISFIVEEREAESALL